MVGAVEPQRSRGERQTMTTIENITREQIKQLRSEAAQAGDEEMEATCEAALHGTDEETFSAREVCIAVISDAEAQQDS